MQPGKLGPEQERCALDGLERALAAGAAILERREGAVDAVEAAARVLEEDACFNAGRGSVLTAEGCIELDAAIMDGRTRDAGAVAGLRTTRAPISLARLLMEEGPHVFLSGRGADEFARGAGLEQVPNSWFEVPERREQLHELLTQGGFDDEAKYGTVGAVAVDVDGHVAVATRPADRPPKRWGRVRDSPLIGAGLTPTIAQPRCPPQAPASISSARLRRTSSPRGCGWAARRCRARWTTCSRTLRGSAARED